MPNLNGNKNEIIGNFDALNDIRKDMSEQLPHTLMMLDSMLQLFTSIIYLNVKENRIESYNITNRLQKDTGEAIRNSATYSDAWGKFIKNSVHPDDKEDLFKFGDIEFIKENMKDRKHYSCVFRRNYDGQYLYTRMHHIKVDGETGELEGLVMCFRVVDDEVKNATQAKLLEDSIRLKEAEYTAKKLQVQQKKLEKLVDLHFSEKNKLRKGLFEGLSFLVVDDDDLTREMSLEILEEEGGTVFLSDTGALAVEMTKNSVQVYDAIIMDLVMPNMDGYEAIRQIRVNEEKAEFHTPIIAFTSDVSDSVYEKVLAAGADDCMSKPLKVMDLSRILISCMKERTVRAEKNLERSVELATTDNLTHVKNYKAFIQKLNEHDDILTQNGNISFATVVCNTNGLRTINSNFGIEMGDMFLKNTCDIICKTFIHSPVYRLGSDEFVIMLENADFENREGLLQSAKGEFQKAAAIEKITDGYTSASFGMAVYDSTKDSKVSDTIARATSLMREEKERNKNEKKGYDKN